MFNCPVSAVSFPTAYRFSGTGAFALAKALLSAAKYVQLSLFSIKSKAGHSKIHPLSTLQHFLSSVKNAILVY
jgi:hypothetical protein